MGPTGSSPSALPQVCILFLSILRKLCEPGVGGVVWWKGQLGKKGEKIILKVTDQGDVALRNH